MAQRTSTQEFRNSTRLGSAVVCAGLFILSVFPWFVTATHSVTDSPRSALTESGLTRSLPQKKVTASEANKPAEIALDYHRWQGGLSTFVVVRDDGSVKLISYDRHRLTISEHQEGVLATSGVTELFTTVRKPTVRRALKLRKRYVEDWGDADLFYLTLQTKSGELTHWFSMGERAPRAIFFLVAKMLALNSKLKNISPGNFDRYLRAERLTPEDTRNVLEKVRPLEITQFSSALQAVVGRAVGHPREFFLLTAEQAGELQKSRTSMLRRAASVYDLRLYDWSKPILIKPPNKESRLTQVASRENLSGFDRSSPYARSRYDLQLFDSLLVPPGKPVLIKEPPNEELHQSLSRVRPPPRFDWPEQRRYGHLQKGRLQFLRLGAFQRHRG